MTLRINDRTIAEAEILAEMQYHPATDVATARHEAARALAVRELVGQEARRRGFGDEPDPIDALLDAVIDVAEPDDAACREAYEQHPDRMRSPDLVEAQHILIAAAPEDVEGRASAKRKAERLLADLAVAPARFGEFARTQSDCASRTNDGMLGQVTRGSTVPEFETFLFSLDAGELCPAPVASRYGFHVVRCLARADGRTLPYEHVRGRIVQQLRVQAWRRAVSDFVARLVAGACIEGVELAPDASP